MKSTLLVIAVVLIFSLIEVSFSLPIFVKLAKRQEFKGEGTYYDPGLGACGFTSSASEMIVAINHAQFDATGGANPNLNPICNKQVSITGPKGTVTCIIVDKCPGCAFGDMDLSPAAFEHIADLSAGRVPITWHFVDGSTPPEKTPTPTPTPEETETPTPTPEETETPTPTPEETETPTPTPEETETPTPTPEETETPTPTPEETETPTPTPEETETPTPTPEETETPTPTPEETETPTPTPEETETPTPTPEETETSTPTPEETETSTPTPEETETPTPTPEETETPTPTPEETETPMPTHTYHHHNHDDYTAKSVTDFEYTSCSLGIPTNN